MGTPHWEKGCLLKNKKFYIRDQSSVASQQSSARRRTRREVMDVWVRKMMSMAIWTLTKMFRESGEFLEN